MDTLRTSTPARSFTPRKPFSGVALALVAGAALWGGSLLTACDGTANGAVLGSDTTDLAFTAIDQTATATFRLSVRGASADTLDAATLGLIVDVEAGGPAIEVSVAPPSGTPSTDTTPEAVTSSGVTYDRYVVTLGDGSALCPASGDCSLDYVVTVSRAGTSTGAFTTTTTVSGVITGSDVVSSNVDLNFL